MFYLDKNKYSQVTEKSEYIIVFTFEEDGKEDENFNKVMLTYELKFKSTETFCNVVKRVFNRKKIENITKLEHFTSLVVIVDKQILFAENKEDIIVKDSEMAHYLMDDQMKFMFVFPTEPYLFDSCISNFSCKLF